ncbi:MAG TPA: hypothetical protein VEK15_22750 [Vicinamibacteria bacterium]|nr:hypothetical protein [Vicinamibacteria bacterium]
MERPKSSLLEENMIKSSRWLLPFALAGVCAACTLDNQQAPELAGPSTVARSITLRAVPDSLVSDGFSSSVIEAVLQGPNGERVPGATIQYDIALGPFGEFLDLGNLAPLNGPRPTAGGVEAGPVSAVTDGDGVARARYWAPFRTDQENDTTVTITARESGTNFRFAALLMAQTDIFLRAANRPSFPGGAFCSFTIEPNKPSYRTGEGIAFTATQLVGDPTSGCSGLEIARYEWNIEPDTYKAGREIVHAFPEEGAFFVELVTTEAVTGCQDICAALIVVDDP